MNLSVSLELILILTIGLFFNSTAFGDCGLKEIVTRSDLSHLTGWSLLASLAFSKLIGKK
jgi:hypothetical protein